MNAIEIAATALGCPKGKKGEGGYDAPSQSGGPGRSRKENLPGVRACLENLGPQTRCTAGDDGKQR
jgi:hypothetical protein